MADHKGDSHMLVVDMYIADGVAVTVVAQVMTTLSEESFQW